MQIIFDDWYENLNSAQLWIAMQKSFWKKYETQPEIERKCFSSEKLDWRKRFRKRFDA
jgi:hypothetical protein